MDPEQRLMGTLLTEQIFTRKDLQALQWGKGLSADGSSLKFMHCLNSVDKHFFSQWELDTNGSLLVFSIQTVLVRCGGCGLVPT